MATFRTNRIFDVLFIAVILAGLGWAALHKVAVTDWLFFATHHPSARVAQLADAAGLNANGRHLLYRTNPQFIASRDDMKAACGTVEDLGCLSSNGTAYLLDQPGRPIDATVTAVHEMLHLAYRGLSDDQAGQLAPDIDAAISQNSALGLDEELSGLSHPNERRDEAHSLLGTEYAHVPSNLERYYQTYFSDRSKVVALYRQSQAP